MTPSESPEPLVFPNADPDTPSLEALLEVSMPVVIEIGRTRMTVQEVLQLGTGSIIQLDRVVGDPVDVYVGDRKLAQAEVVVVGEHFGIRITRVLATASELGAAA